MKLELGLKSIHSRCTTRIWWWDTGQVSHSRPLTGMLWSGIEAQVVPGAPCGRLLLPPGHELLLRLAARPRCQDRGKGAWDVVVLLRGAGGSRGPMQMPATAAPRSHMRATSLPGQGKGVWDVVQGIGAQVVPENAEGHRCCRRGMNCCCASAAHKGGLSAAQKCVLSTAQARPRCQDWGWGPGIDRGVPDSTGCSVAHNVSQSCSSGSIIRSPKRLLWRTYQVDERQGIVDNILHFHSCPPNDPFYIARTMVVE